MATAKLKPKLSVPFVFCVFVYLFLRRGSCTQQSQAKLTYMQILHKKSGQANHLGWPSTKPALPSMSKKEKHSWSHLFSFIFSALPSHIPGHTPHLTYSFFLMSLKAHRGSQDSLLNIFPQNLQSTKELVANRRVRWQQAQSYP